MELNMLHIDWLRWQSQWEAFQSNNTLEEYLLIACESDIYSWIIAIFKSWALAPQASVYQFLSFTCDKVVISIHYNVMNDPWSKYIFNRVD